MYVDLIISNYTSKDCFYKLGNTRFIKITSTSERFLFIVINNHLEFYLDKGGSVYSAWL